MASRPASSSPWARRVSSTIFLLAAALLVSTIGKKKPTREGLPAQESSLRLSSLQQTSAPYNESLAKYAMDFSGASYCCGTLGKGVAKWDCAVCKKYPGVQTTVAFSAKDNANAFVSWNPHDGESGSVLVAIAGTDPLSIKDWLDDLDFFHAPEAIYTQNGCTGCEVHTGFFQTYASIRDQIRAAVKNYTSAHPNAPLRVSQTHQTR